MTDSLDLTQSETEQVQPPEPQDATARPESPPSRVEVFLGFGLPAARELRALLPMDEEMFVRVSGVAHGDGKAYVLYGALDEVEKSLMQLIRLQDLVDGNRVDPREDRMSRLVITHIVEEERARARRLIELLVTLVLFGTTDENAYYRHLIAIEELRDHLYHNQDLEDFHGARSANVDYSIEWTTDRVIEQQAEIKIDNAWYLKKRALISVAPPMSARKLSQNLKPPSMRDLVKLALPLMNAHEKLHFGTSYDEVYSRASESVHFGVLPKASGLGAEDDIGGAVRLGLLAMNIIDRVHGLMGRPPVAVVEKIAAGIAHPKAPEYLFLWTQREIEVGDFVMADRYLAEVLEVRSSAFGNNSYRIRFLAERPIPEIMEDWYQARFIHRLYNRAEVLRKLDRPSAQIIPEAVRDLMRKAAPEELQALLREVLPVAWNAGLREWSLARLTTLAAG